MDETELRELVKRLARVEKAIKQLEKVADALDNSRRISSDTAHLRRAAKALKDIASSIKD